MRLLYVLLALWKVKRSVSTQKRYNQEYLVPILKEFEDRRDPSLTKADLERILKIDAINISVVIGESFAALRGQELSFSEREAITNLAAITLLFDDYFDRLDYIKEDIKSLMTPGDYQPKNTHEKLFRMFFDQALSSIPDNDRLFKYADQVFEAQYYSKEQQLSSPTYEEIIDLTLKKGGYSILFYRSALENDLSPEEEELAFHLGGMIQLGDDIYDTFWDAKNHIRTFTTVSHDLMQVYQDFNAQIQRCFGAIDATSLPEKNKKEFRLWVEFAASLSLSALDQLFNLQESTMGFFDAIAYTRKEMICDMQKFKPQMRALRHFMNMSKAENERLAYVNPELISSGQAS